MRPLTVLAIGGNSSVSIVAIQLISIPVEKALPVPVRIIALTCLSLAASSNAMSISPIISILKAFSFSGRLRVIVATSPSLSSRTIL